MQQALFKLPDAVKMGKESKYKGKKSYCEVVFTCSKIPFEKFLRQYVTVKKKKRTPIKRSQMMRDQWLATLVTQVKWN